jgi:dephospho-CoA kinase
MTKIIGLTGGIGSGKTTIAKHIQSFGIPVYFTDDEAKKILALPEIIKEITHAFGTSILENNAISKKRLSDLVFTSPEKLKQLNAIIHPAVNNDFKNWLEINKKAPFVVKESAILFESGAYKNCDNTITVIAPLETRILRVMERDATTREKVMDRINNQWTDEMRIAKSDFVIKNEEIEIAITQTDAILKEFYKINKSC